MLNAKPIKTAMLLLIIELIIAWFFTDFFIRGFLGDVLVIPLLYYGFTAFFKNNDKLLSEKILLLAFLIEFLQQSSITEVVSSYSKIGAIIFGKTFDVWDLVAYVFGYLVIKKNN